MARPGQYVIEGGSESGIFEGVEPFEGAVAGGAQPPEHHHQAAGHERGEHLLRPYSLKLQDGLGPRPAGEGGLHALHHRRGGVGIDSGGCLGPDVYREQDGGPLIGVSGENASRFLSAIE